MKNVSLRGLLISVLALLSIGQGVQAKSKSAELAEASKELGEAYSALRKCMKKVCDAPTEQGRQFCAKTFCAFRNSVYLSKKAKVDRLRKK